MTREMSADVRELWRRIHCLVEVLEENGGSLKRKDALELTARRAEIYTSDVDYVITSAQAERVVSYSLRTSIVTLLEPENEDDS